MKQRSSPKLHHTKPANTKVAPDSQSEKLARTTQPPLPKIKETEPSIHYDIVKWEVVKVGKSSTLVRKRMVEARAWSRKNKALHQKITRFAG